MFTGMILVRIDECGDEQEVERFDLHLDLDEDELEIWKSRKIAKAEELSRSKRVLFRRP